MGSVTSLSRIRLRTHTRSWLTAALLVGLAGGAVLAAAAGAQRTNSAYARFLSSSRGADVEIAVSGPGGVQNLGGASNFFDAIAGLAGVEAVAPTAGASAVASSRSGTAVLLRAGVDDRLGRLMERPKITEGRMFEPSRVNEAVADRTLAAQLDLHEGSTLHLSVAAAGSDTVATKEFEVTVHVVGVAVTRDNVVPISSLAQEGSLLITPALLAELTPEMYTYEAAFVRLRDGASVDAFRSAAQALVRSYPETGGQLFLVDEHLQAGKVERAIRPEAVALALFALLVAVMSILIIGQILIRQIYVATSDYPTYRALGMTRAGLMSVGMAEVGAAIAVGVVIAFGIAGALSGLMPIGPARLAEPHAGPTLNWAILALGAAVLALVFTLRVAPSIWRATEGSTTLNRHTERPSVALETLTGLGAPPSATIGAQLALRPGRGGAAVPIRSALAEMAIAVAVVGAAFTFGTNLVRLVNTPKLYGQTWQASIDVEFDVLSKARVEDVLRSQQTLSGWSFGSHDEATLESIAVPAIVLTAGNGPTLYPTLLEGRPPATSNEILVGTKTLAAIQRRIGQTVTLTTQSDETPRTVRIVGTAVFPFFGQGEVTPTGLGDGIAMLDSTPGTDAFNFVLIAADRETIQPGDITQLTRDLNATNLCPQACVLVTAQRPADVSNYARVSATPGLLAGVLAALSVVGIVHLLVTTTRRRRRDIAVLRALGFIQRQVSAAVAWQASITMAIAIAIGLPAGLIIGRWTWLSFGTRLGLSPDVQLPLRAALWFVPAAFAVVNVVAAVPGWHAARQPLAPILRGE
jgi:putative ABC transport system permease protein